MDQVLTELIDQVKSLSEIDSEVYELTKTSFDKRVELAYQELASLISDKQVPIDFHFMVVQVSLKRYKRKGHEGQKSYDQSEQRITFDTGNDFREYEGAIERYNQSLVCKGAGYQWF
ncbi:MAG: phage head-tail connector protein [Vagococcus salmoninarum]|uniref:phage head-tail connector protein n=1 Tax=Vagococcus salmoninarum TaxID=2739 RepID=UPI003F9CA183